ncbi:HTH domain-containing protein [Sediminispirochaeta bajacaliforniensis]|uniref:HTH domain-containing protein n=1 Tax=Sediminispirochaeta bajacaliforniensis TaxID=148 RepID=UPI000380BBCB|nr:HTH domain-containing protein [Sediminispirochaeta bajacaliforniensis]
MKQRVGTILKLLTANHDWVTIDKIAEESGAGVRTIHRDLQRLEHLLALRGIPLERKRGVGVRISSPLSGRLDADDLYAGLRLEVESEKRPIMILLYLITGGRWIKYGELSHTFFVSDSSVGNDLDQIELFLPRSSYLERRKGVGVRLCGDEWALRKLFTRLFPSLLPREGMGFFYPSASKQESHAPRKLLGILGIDQLARGLRDALGKAEDVLGAKFSPPSLMILFCYLFVSHRRISEGGILRDPLDVPSRMPHLPGIYIKAARSCGDLAFHRLFGETLPQGELVQLARILASGEIVQLSTPSPSLLLTDLFDAVDRIVERTLTTIEEEQGVWLHEDNELLSHLKLMIAAAIRRIVFGVPSWRPEGHQAKEDVGDPYSLTLVREFGLELSAFLSIPDFARLLSELRNAAVTLSAGVERVICRRYGGIRVRVVCFEGIGMSRYIESLVRELLPPGGMVDAAWCDPAQAAGLGKAEPSWDLVISTYPIRGFSGRLLQISGDESADIIRDRLRRTIAEIPLSTHATNLSEECSRDSSVDFSSLLRILDGFFLTVYEENDDRHLVEAAVDAVADVCLNRRQLETDFLRRESYGSLRFEDQGIRVLHCRSAGVREAKAGILRPRDARGGEVLLVLVAPAHAEQRQTKALSELVILTADSEDFCRLLKGGERSEIQSYLLRRFSDFHERWV